MPASRAGDPGSNPGRGTPSSDWDSALRSRRLRLGSSSIVRVSSDLATLRRSRRRRPWGALPFRPKPKDLPSQPSEPSPATRAPLVCTSRRAGRGPSPSSPESRPLEGRGCLQRVPDLQQPEPSAHVSGVAEPSAIEKGPLDRRPSDVDRPPLPPDFLPIRSYAKALASSELRERPAPRFPGSSPCLLPKRF